MSQQALSEKTIFNIARQIAAADARLEYLHRACGQDPALFAEVAALLEIDDQQKTFLSAVAVERPSLHAESPQQVLGTQIGPYKIRELLGEGGMGSVYVAEQEKPVRRKVALKVVKAGMDSRQVLARFDAERQALALMDHPDIAKVLDAGTSESGRPYFVMELVRGVPITEFCDSRKLTTHQRLELFTKVCQAVQHAHQKGIIHRDIKPSNVLVTLHDDVAVPKVIDFGIAKATSQALTDQSIYTGVHQMLGTPLYMSPEQAEMNSLDIDTRSDVYSLGVLFYELITGTTPFDKETLTKAGYDEMRRMIREVDPPRPSARVSTLQAQALTTVSDCRKIDPRKLSQQLRGELDWIVMKALEKDRSRRYESASAFAADVQRYLDDQPVEACPPSMVYWLRKFVRRRRQAATIAAVATLAATIVVGVVLGAWISARQANDARAGRIRDALLSANASIEPGSLDQAENRLVQAKTLLAEGAPIAHLAAQLARIDTDIIGRRKDRNDLERFRLLAEEGLQDGIGATYLENMEQSATKALDLFGVLKNDQWLTALRRRHFTPAEQKEIQETAYITLLFLADHEVRWIYDAKHAVRGQELLDRLAAFHEPTRAFHFVQAQIHRIQGNSAAAEAADARFRTTAAVSAWDYYLPGHTFGWNGDLPEAIRSYEAALRIQPNHYQSLYFLAMRLGRLEIGRTVEAIRLYAACMALRPNDPLPLISRGNTYYRLGDNEAAEADYARAIELAKINDERIDAVYARACFYLKSGQEQKERQDLEQLIPLRQKRLDARQAEFGTSAVETLKAMQEMGLAYHWLKRADKAIPLLESARAEFQRNWAIGI